MFPNVRKIERLNMKRSLNLKESDKKCLLEMWQ